VTLSLRAVRATHHTHTRSRAGVRYRRGPPPLDDHRRLHDVRGRLQALQPSRHERVHVALPEDVL
jgi:hypothetical protein